jgi:hypothetical protein
VLLITSLQQDLEGKREQTETEKTTYEVKPPSRDLRNTLSLSLMRHQRPHAFVIYQRPSGQPFNKPKPKQPNAEAQVQMHPMQQAQSKARNTSDIKKRKQP